MSLYKTGTVSVNNGQNTVTGTGTSFIDIANVQLGDLFTVDGSKFYEIYQVDTNTQIRIRNIVTGGNFAETTVTNGDYAIVRNFTSQTSAEIAAKVLAVQQKWQNREEEMTDWFYTSDNWADVTSINGDVLTVMTPNGINNLLGPGALGPDCRTFGIGQLTQQPDWPNSNLDNCDGVASGTYRTSGAVSSPDQTAIVYFSRRNAGQLQQILVSGYDASNTNTFQWRNSNGGSDSAPTWGDWKTVYHSGNSANILDYGGAIRNKNLVAATNLDTLYDNGTYTAYGTGSGSASTGDNPFNINGAFSITVSRNTFGSDEYCVQTAILFSTTVYIKVRSKASNASGWTSWETLYHSGNTNFNVHEIPSGRVLSHMAVGVTTDVVDCELPLNSKSNPTSISTTGTFTIFSTTSGATLASNVTPTLAPTSYSRSGILRFAVSGASVGTRYRVVADVGGSSITFNF